jgi:Transposase DNA-binding/Transposase Tn5 dimerisation domain
MSTDPHLLGPIPPTTAQAWAAAELGQAALGDPRRTRRLVQLTAAVATQPQASLAQACGDPARTKAAYRFFEGTDTAFHERPAAIRAAHCQATQARVAAWPRVLAVQDTTSLDFTGHVVADVGELGPPGHYGLFVHSTLAVLPEHGIPQGLLAQEVWARPGAPPGGRLPRRERPVAAKESQKWLTALAASRTAVPTAVTLVHVGDREADVYELFLAGAAQPGTELLVRAAQDRRVQAPTGTLWAELAAQPIADTRRVELPQANGRPARVVELSLRWTRVTLRPPQYRAAEHLPEQPVDAVLVREEAPAPGAEPIEWLLLTTVPVDQTADAWERVRWYTYRWLVERYHYVLKSGCRIEQRHLETAARLECCLAVYAVVACWLLRLVYSARATPEAPVATLLAPEEWAVLWTARHPTQPLPPAPTLRQLVREIAGLGGFLGRRGDGEPGVKTLWQGLDRLHDLLLGYHLARQLSQLVGNP